MNVFLSTNSSQSSLLSLRENLRLSGKKKFCLSINDLGQFFNSVFVEIQLTLELHRFELCGSTDMQIFFRKYSTTRSVVGGIHEEPWIRRVDCGTWHPPILISMAGSQRRCPGTKSICTDNINMFSILDRRNSKRLGLTLTSLVRQDEGRVKGKVRIKKWCQK